MYYRLAPEALLVAWETGVTRRPLDRALAMLWAAGAGGADPAALPVAERDRLLLAIRAATFGTAMPAQATCPGCGAELELTLDTADIAAALPHAWAAGPHVTSRDLAAIDGLSAESGMSLLCKRHSAEDVGAIAESIASAEPMARLTCAECGHEWPETVDIPAHLWADIEVAAQRLLSEIAALASAFGWGETEILALSPTRRRAYLSLAGVP